MLAKFFFCVFIDRDEVDKDWSIKDLLLYDKKENFFLRPCGTNAESPEPILPLGKPIRTPAREFSHVIKDALLF